MSSPGLERLAVETLQQICECLDKVSLRNFGAMSKQCQAIANVRLFKEVCIRVLSRKKLQLDVEIWTRKLESVSSLQHVRQLKIQGRMPRAQYEVGQIERGKPPSPIVNNSDDELGGMRIFDMNHRADEAPPYVVLEEDDAWKPLANFIRQLPALADLVYSCTNQFSPCLLQALRQDCRLHLGAFRFRSNLEEVDIDPHEFALATSPHLHSISAESCTFYNETGVNYKDDYNDEAILRVVSGLAPRLKEVRVYRAEMSAAPGLSNAFKHRQAHPRPPWRGFLLDENKAVHCPGKLTRLELGGFPVQLELWGKHVDLSVLTVLKLGRETQAEDLSWAVENSPFHALATLVLHLDVVNYGRLPEHEYYELVKSFFRSLPPLKSLRAIGHLSPSTFETVVGHHGKSLRQLWVDNSGNHSGEVDEKYQLVCNRTLVEKITRLCPVLEDLTLPVARTKGDAQEVSIYRILGTLPRLQKLSLTFVISNPRTELDHNDEIQCPSDPSFDTFEQQIMPRDGGRHAFSHYPLPRNGHVQDALINSAIDERLARAIFRCISSGKGKGGNTLQLERLELSATGGSDFGDGCRVPGLSAVLATICRSWHIVRNPRDDSRNELMAVEIDRQERLETEKRVDEELGASREPLSKPLMLVFRRIWPVKKEGTGTWRDDWYGLPLSEH